MKRVLLAAALLCGITVAVPASADVIFDNGSPNLVNAYPSNTDFGLIVADNFVLSTGSETITDIHWWGFYVPDAVSDDFTVLIYGDNGGLPDASSPLLNLTSANVSRTATGDQISNGGPFYDIYEYSLDIDPLALTAGSTYYLAIQNNTAGWYWALSNSSGTSYYDSAPYDVFTTGSGELAFTLTNDGVVPEPASILLMGLGLGGVAWRARKKRS